jgi:site-specific DNA recombinase
MMDTVAALYARVSSEQQAAEGTIGSQVAALQTRIAADGLVVLPQLEFRDDGHSGATLLRPALERLRDAAAAGQIDRLYVHSPDRLARKYAYQVLLLDELQQAGVEVVFLNRELGRSPEDDLLLQVQGMIAEYERAKITERNRRGKRYQASQGAVSVLGSAPYGYRYVPKAEGGGAARYEIVLEEARVVRQLFTWVGQERWTLGQMQRRLAAEGIPSPGGKPTWSRGTIRRVLANPAYAGHAAYGKTRNAPYVPPLRQYQSHPPQPRSPVTSQPVPSHEWITIPVPAIVSAELLAAASEQLAENRLRAREHTTGASSLLQGLLCCARCGYAYVSIGTRSSRRDGTRQTYRYYRCSGTEPRRFGGTRICTNRAIPLDLAEAVVWQEVRTVLEDPDRLRTEYERRLQTGPGASEADRQRLEMERRRLLQGRERLIDSYAEGLLDPTDFTPRITRLKDRLAEVEAQLQQVQEGAARDQELRLVLGHLEEFAAQVTGHLEAAEEETKRTIVRALVKRVEIDLEEIHVVFRIPSHPPDAGPNGSSISHHWRGRSFAGPPYRSNINAIRSRGRARLCLSQLCWAHLCEVLGPAGAGAFGQCERPCETALSPR